MIETELQMKKRIDYLEMKLAFQDLTIEELNGAMIQQQISLDKINERITFIITELRTMEPENIANTNEAPPHY